ncbi:MAG: hypothetical protein FWE50_03370 [Alphaproteobacteria bacterium]|nr:hypothetical protein [Alphaproteobacteria bacterium]
MKFRFLPFAFCLLPFGALAADVAPSRAIPGKQTAVEQPARTETETLNVVESRTTELPAAPVSQASARTATVSRTAATATGRGESITDVSRQVGRSARTEAASLNATAPIRRAGLTLRPTTAEVGGRAVIRGTGVQTGSNIGAENRKLTVRAATVGPEEVSIEEASLATEACLAQYMDCMDQFCSVIDANQKRCSCSSRLQSYSRIENAVKEANSQLNDVAQRIRYVGLTAQEIRSIMQATEAELALQSTKDTTQSRKMLDQIEKLIRQPENFVAENNSFGLDLDINFDSMGGDIMELFNLEGNSGSFSNLRGTELYNAAKKRCQNVLNSCKTRGANVSQVTGRYDMEIDKDCIAYEKGLEKMNQTLKSNVRSATQMLQKARLAVLQDHNTYDAKGCVGALEQCMHDDMVCGSDYAKCLDPTKRFIDENGQVILGQNVSSIRKMMNNFDNSKIDTGFITSAWGMTGYMNCDVPGQNDDGKCIVKYLLSKIGMGDVNSGLCRPVLDKCRSYTYDARGKYDNKNSIVVGYIQRAMTNIRAAQEQIISDFASSCMADIAVCYSKQITQINAWSTNANIQNVYAVLKGACRNVALTCSYAVFAADDSMAGCPTAPLTNPPYSAADVIATVTDAQRQNICIENISDIFYQSMLCPDNSFWVQPQLGTKMGSTWPVTETCSIGPNTGDTCFTPNGGKCTNGGGGACTASNGNCSISGTTCTYTGVVGVFVNERCVCQAGYGVNMGRCDMCPAGATFQPSCGAYSIDGQKCIMVGCGCPGDKIYNSSTGSCACRGGAGAIPNGDSCCPVGEVYIDALPGCGTCAAGEIYDSATRTCNCPAGTSVGGGGSPVASGSSCECPLATPNWSGTACVGP